MQGNTYPRQSLLLQTPTLLLFLLLQHHEISKKGRDVPVVAQGWLALSVSFNDVTWGRHLASPISGGSCSLRYRNRRQGTFFCCLFFFLPSSTECLVLGLSSWDKDEMSAWRTVKNIAYKIGMLFVGEMQSEVVAESRKTFLRNSPVKSYINRYL